MKKRTNTTIKMFLSLCMCALSLFSLITISFAWFAMNKKADSDGMNVAAKNGALIAECEYFVVDNETKESGAGYFFIAATAEDKNRLGTYDVLNDNYQFLIKVKLSSATTVKVVAKTETNYFLGSATAKTDGHLLTADGSGNALSNVVSFAVPGRNEVTADGNGYKLAALPEETVCFFDRTALTAATEPYASVTLTSENGLTVTADENGEAYFFILLSYDTLLISTVFSANIGNAVLAQYEKIPFELDFSIDVSGVKAA